MDKNRGFLLEKLHRKFLDHHEVREISYLRDGPLFQKKNILKHRKNPQSSNMLIFAIFVVYYTGAGAYKDGPEI